MIFYSKLCKSYISVLYIISLQCFSLFVFLWNLNHLIQIQYKKATVNTIIIRKQNKLQLQRYLWSVKQKNFKNDTLISLAAVSLALDNRATSFTKFLTSFFKLVTALFKFVTSCPCKLDSLFSSRATLPSSLSSSRATLPSSLVCNRVTLASTLPATISSWSR